MRRSFASPRPLIRLRSPAGWLLACVALFFVTFGRTFAQAPETGAFDVSAVAVSRPVKICDLDLGQLNGSLRRLSWNSGGTSLHLQTRDSDDRLYDYIVDLVTHDISRAFGEPGWAAEYWTQKSALAAPGLPSLKLEVTENNRRTRPMPFSGGFTNGGAQTFDPKDPVDAYEHEVTLRYLGHEIGNWINGTPMAGDTFGWGPVGTGALVYTDERGHLTLIDRAKHTRGVPDTKDACFPAWSADGSRIAFLQKAARRKYVLMTVAVDR
jgi:hypothetical protein